MEIDEKQNTGESSPSVTVEEIQPGGVAVEDLTSEQRTEWLSSGKLPDAKKEEESQPPKEEKVTEGESSPPEKKVAAVKEKEAEPAPAPKVQEKVEIPPHEARIKELLARTKILEQRLAEKEKVPGKPAEPVVEDKVPQPEDYETQADYLADRVKYEVAQGIKKEREKRETEETRLRVEATNKEILKNWNDRVVEAQKVHKDFNEKVFADTFNIVEGSVLDRWCLKSKHGAEVLYHYATHPEEFAKLNQIADPLEAVQEIARLEIGILEKPKPAPKLVSDAPKPVTEVSGRGTATDDPIAEALASGDIQKYMRLMNEKERASSRK